MHEICEWIVIFFVSESADAIIVQGVASENHTNSW